MYYGLLSVLFMLGKAWLVLFHMMHTKAASIPLSYSPSNRSFLNNLRGALIKTHFWPIK